MRSFSWLFAAKCLSDAPDTGGLDAVHERGTHDARHDRVFGEVLEVAAAQRRPLDVGARSEDDRDVFDRGLDAEGLADALGELDVPRRAERDGGREARRRHAVAEAEVVAALACLRRPCGPSVSMTAGMPTRSTGLVSRSSRRS